MSPQSFLKNAHDIYNKLVAGILNIVEPVGILRKGCGGCHHQMAVNDKIMAIGGEVIKCWEIPISI